MPIPPGVKIVPKKGESKAQAKARLEAKYDGGKALVVNADPPRKMDKQSQRNFTPRGETPQRGNTPSPTAGLPVRENPPTRSVPPATAPNRGARLSTESSQSQLYSAYANKPYFPVETNGMQGEMPVRVVELPSGARLSTPYGRDLLRTAEVEAVVWELSNASWNNFTNNPASTDPLVTTLTTRMLGYFNELVAMINFNGRFIPTEVLATPGDFSSYLTQYHIVFNIVWTFLSVVQNLDTNASTRQFGAGVAGSGNLERALMLWKRLQKVPIPPQLPILLSEITGMFYSEPADMVILGYVNTASNATTVTDWTLSTGAQSVGTLLSLAETSMTNIESAAGEAGVIFEMMAMAYGVPQPLPVPYMHTDLASWDLWFTQAAVFLVAAAIYAEPGPAGSVSASGILPILLRTDEDPHRLAFTALRPQLYNFGATGSQGATSTLTGLMSIADTIQSYSRAYGTFGAEGIITDSLFAALNFGNASFLEVSWWAAFTQSTSGTVRWTADSRSYDRWDVFYATVEQLAMNTGKVLDEIFLNGLRIREL